MAMGLLLGLLAVMAASLTLIVGTQPRIADRSSQIQDGRVMIERITRELREGSSIESPTASGVSFLTYVRTTQCGAAQPPPSSATPAIQCRVTYTCTAGRCVRSEAPPTAPGSGTTKTLLDGLRSSQVFSYTPVTNPDYVSVTLEYPGEEGGESITLTDGAAMRNTAG